MAYGYIAGILASGANVETALQIHCTHNVFPPIDVRFIPSLREAIDLVNEGDFYSFVQLPTGAKLRAVDIINEVHLDAFIDVMNEGDFYGDD